jgi:predicted ATPase
VAPDAHLSAFDQPNEKQLAEDQVPQRYPFVGRERELRELRHAFDTTAKGDGALNLLVGEPGIGKTALSDQLCRFVSASGGLPLVGHCYEEGSFRPPYQPFVEVFASYLHGLDTEALQADLGSSAADLARIVPTLRERLNIAPRPPGDPEEDRWRLLQAATDLLRSASAKQPLLVVLEDLHDADRGTLDLLLYVARNLHGARILVVGTYRDVEVDRAHPLSAALTELHRASNVARVQLHGLSTDEVQRLLAEASQQTIPQPFAELVQRQTEGNPLFVRETLRFVIDTGLVERRDGALRRVDDQSLAGRIPEGLRDAVGKRLSRLSESTNRVLSVASVIGREFQLDVLRQVLACTDEVLEAALEEAVAAVILEEQSVTATAITYRFSHAFFRQTLYDEIIAPRRIRLHREVAHGLELVFARQLAHHAAELADHYSFSSDATDLARAVHYAELAAGQAIDVFAHGEAVRQLERAVQIQELVDSDDRARRCDLLLKLGDALAPAGQTQRAVTYAATEALALSEESQDARRAFRASRLALDSLDAEGAGSATFRPEYLRWAERADRYAQPEGIERVHADLALANAWFAQGRLKEVHVLRVRALALARQHDDPETLFKCAFHLMFNSEAPQYWPDRLRLAEESTSWPTQGVSGRALGALLFYSGWVLLADGQRAQAEALWRQVEEVAERTNVVTVRLFVAQRDVLLAIVDGRLEETMALLERFVARADVLGVPVRGRQFAIQMLHTPAIHLGRGTEWLDSFQAYVPLAGRVTQTTMTGAWLIASQAVCLAHIGRFDEARALAGRLLDDQARIRGNDEQTGTYLLVTLLEAAVLLEHRDAAQALGARLATVAHLATGDYTCVARHLGEAATLAGDRAAARAYYRQALDAAGKIRFRPELALVHLRLAELLLQESEHAARFEALGHLDLAVPELGDMKMQPALERAQALKDKFEAATARPPGRQSASDTLTAREREIASLMADGWSNREIAEKLILSEGTVDVHVKHILGKLGFRSRAQVAGWVGRRGSV